MYRVFLAIVAVALLSGCSDKSTPSDSGSENSDQSMVSIITDSQLPYGIGDTESSIVLAVRMPGTVNRDGLRYIEVRTKKNDLAKAEATISKPYPEKLPAIVEIGNRRDFDGHAVRVMPRLFIDNVEVASFAFVYDADAKRGQRQFEVDLMDYLDEIPETLLVHAQAEVHLFMTTDPAEITIDTPLGADAQSAEKLSNGLRLNFQ